MILKRVFNIIINALFPINKIDAILLSLPPKEAYRRMKRSGRSPVPLSDSILAYKDPMVTRLIWNIKYKKNKKALEIGAYILHKKITEINKYGEDKIIIVPIPASKRRIKERGFNQCQLLAEKIFELDNTKNLIKGNDLVSRKIHRNRQTLKGRKERLADAKNVFEINQEELTKIKEIFIEMGKDIYNIPVIIIDDVITTGGTIDEAIKTLISSGFTKVTGLSLAH